MNSTLYGDRLLQLLAPQRIWSFHPVWRYGLAIVIVVAATWLPRALIPRLGTTAPYNVALVALVVATVLSGIGPGLVSVRREAGQPARYETPGDNMGNERRTAVDFYPPGGKAYARD